MTADELERKKEEADKATIIDTRIVRLIERLGGYERITDDRRAGLKRMTRAELSQLVQRLEGALAAEEGIQMLVTAIANSDEAGRGEERRRDDELSGPASTEWL